MKPIDNNCDPAVTESRLRRRAARLGLRLVKSRRRNYEAIDYGTFLVVDVATNCAVSPQPLLIDEVEAFLA